MYPSILVDQRFLCHPLIMLFVWYGVYLIVTQACARDLTTNGTEICGTVKTFKTGGW